MSLGYPLLAVDCSRGAGSLVLALSADQWRGRILPAGQNQASDLLPEAQALLQSEGLSLRSVRGFVLGQGPGSFTGLRIAAGLVQGMARGLGVGVACVSGFFAMAYAHAGRRGSSAEQAVAAEPSRLGVYFDARLGEYYYAAVTIDAQGYPVGYACEPEIVSALPDEAKGVLRDPQPEAFLPPTTKLVSGDLSLQSLAAWSLAVVLDAPDPTALFLPPIMAQPLYVRSKVAQTRVEREQGPALQLQPLSSHDLASVMVIENQAYAFPWTSGNFRDALAAGYTALKLVDQGAMVGYCVYMRVLEEAHLLNFTIAPPRQRRGLGQAFLERLLARVADEGAASMLLEVRPSNEAGIRLYARNGFAEIGRRKGYYPAEKGSREDALLMQRALSLQAQGLREARARAIAADVSQEGTFAMAQALAPDLRS
ncbi:MAG: ribosomal protein S18-alanine N-acetyltransferase [Burkholderiaceae bacterium]